MTSCTLSLRKARIDPLPHVPRQLEGASFACVTKGLELPVGGLAYVVRVQEPANKSRNRMNVQVVGLIDCYSRVWECEEPQGMLPARQPIVRLMRAAGENRDQGRVELLPADGPVRSVGRWTLAGNRVRFVGADDALGDAAKDDYTIAQAAALALVGWVLVPRALGLDSPRLTVSDVAEVLRARPLFEAIDEVVRLVEEEADRCFVGPAGVLEHLARMLRDAGAVGVKPIDLAPKPGDISTFDLSWTSIAGLAGMLGIQLPQGLPTITVLPGAPGRLDAPAVVPDIRLVRTIDYSNMFYIVYQPNQVSPDGARLLLEVESILNRFVMLSIELGRRRMLASATTRQCAELDAWLVERICDQAASHRDDIAAAEPPEPTLLDGRDNLRAPFGFGVTHRAAVDDESDVGVRIAFSQACEGLMVPYRLDYRLRFDAAADHLLVDASCPEACVMAREAYDADTDAFTELSQADREGRATRYAFHLCALIAMAGLWCSRRPSQVTVNLWRKTHEGDSPVATRLEGETCVLSARFGRAQAAQALEQADVSAWPRDFVDQFPHAYTLGANFALTGTCPLTDLNDVVQGGPGDVERREELRALARAGDVTLAIDSDRAPFDEKAVRLLCARQVKDMAIYEDSSRKLLADEVVTGYLDQGMLGALRAVRDIHDRTENIPLRQACDRLSDDILEERVAGDARDEIRNALSDVYGLRDSFRKATRAFQEDPASAVSSIEAALRHVDEARWFEDSQNRAYRYFDSYASRAIYGARCAGDLAGRELRLCADEYFLMNHRLATMLSDTLDRNEDAIAYAKRAVELAPSVAAARLRLARCYFCSFDYLSEIEELKSVLTVAWNPSDVGLALYWLGYAFWMTGDHDTGLACYQRSISFDPHLAEAVTAEVAEMARREGERPQLMSVDEMDELMAAAGVDVSVCVSNANLLCNAADAALRAGSVQLAQNLLGSAMAMLHDDALSPVIESLDAE